MNDLTELKEIKLQKSNELTLRKQDTNYEMDRVQDDIEKLRREKEYLVSRQQGYNKENDDRARKIEHFEKDIGK